MTFIDYEIKNRIGTIWLNRPEKRNALNQETVLELNKVFCELENSHDVKIIVLRGKGKVFCAGADLEYIKQLEKFSYEENLKDSKILMKLFKSIYNSSKITVSVVQGAALAGGCGLAAICDFCFAEENAKFGYTEARIGFIPALVMAFLPERVGIAKAKELMLDATIFMAQEAKYLGLISDYYSENVLEDKLSEKLNHWLENISQNSVSAIKELLSEIENLEVNKSLEIAAEFNAKARSNEDCKKGIAAFLNKEKIKWK